MKTITAKELRDNMGDIVRRVNGGEHIRVTYRAKSTIKILPYYEGDNTKKSTTPNDLPGLAAFDSAPRKKYEFDKNKSIKQLYHELLEEKYGK